MSNQKIAPYLSICQLTRVFMEYSCLLWGMLGEFVNSNKLWIQFISAKIVWWYKVIDVAIKSKSSLDMGFLVFDITL